MTKSERAVRDHVDGATCRKIRGEGRYLVGGYTPDNLWHELGRGETRAEAWGTAAERVRKLFEEAFP